MPAPTHSILNPRILSSPIIIRPSPYYIVITYAITVVSTTRNNVIYREYTLSIHSVYCYRPDSHYTRTILFDKRIECNKGTMHRTTTLM